MTPEGKSIKESLYAKYRYSIYHNSIKVHCNVSSDEKSKDWLECCVSQSDNKIIK